MNFFFAPFEVKKYAYGSVYYVICMIYIFALFLICYVFRRLIIQFSDLLSVSIAFLSMHEPLSFIFMYWFIGRSFGPYWWADEARCGGTVSGNPLFDSMGITSCTTPHGKDREYIYNERKSFWSTVAGYLLLNCTLIHEHRTIYFNVLCLIYCS